MKPVLYARMKGNEVDWSEDCVAPSPLDLEEDDGCHNLPLYSIPLGWKLVPLEPTTAMLMAGKIDDTVKERYQAQLAAAPTGFPAQVNK